MFQIFISTTLFIFLFILSNHAAVVISEVSPNPPGSSTTLPGDGSHEFIEFYNNGSEAVNLCRYFIKSGSVTSTAEPDSNNIQVWSGDSLLPIGGDSMLTYDSLLQPGQYGLLLGRKYISAPESTRYLIRSGAAVFATRKTYIRSGTLANASTWIELYDEHNQSISTFNHFQSKSIDPGEKLTWHRIAPDSTDRLDNWKLAPPTPGGAFPYASSRTYGYTLIINEFMNDPAIGNPEWVELFNYGIDTVNLAGFMLGGNEINNILISAEPCLIPPNAFCVVAESGGVGRGYFQDLLCPLMVPDDWDALRRDDDIISLYNEKGERLDSLHYLDGWFAVAKGVSCERKDTRLLSTFPESWRKSLHGSGATPGFANSAVAAAISAFGFEVQNRSFCPQGSSIELSRLEIALSAPAQGSVILKIFDLKGRSIKTLVNKQEGVRTKRLFWDGSKNNGQQASAGPYLVYGEYRNGTQVTVRKKSIVLTAK
ncbi:MAG: hypothetical protein A2293_05715 [Elusimicrobia bacterium RIFOXYB2_FULL_49_7]|nr:MAG: hypothetical protein A2293_05715 [Elusimicrobia bacterium RIFOXYB2_FULL_49_7]